MDLFAEAVSVLQGMEDEKSVALRALAMAHQGYFMAWLGLSERGYELSKESVAILGSLDRPDALGFAYLSLDFNAYFLNRYTEDIEVANKILKIAAKIDEKWLLAFSLFVLSMAAVRKGDYAEARRLARSSLDLNLEIGNLIGSTWPLLALGHEATARGDHEGARGFFQRCLEVSQETGFRFAMQNSNKYLGRVALSMGDFTAAENYLVQSLRITREIGLLRDILNLIYEFACLRAAQGKPEGAVELLALILRHPASHQVRWLEGRIRDSAKSLLAELEGELPPQAYAAALERSQGLDLDGAIDRLVGARSRK
jgi:tetratricopeptide (TPR) repeat protein